MGDEIQRRHFNAEDFSVFRFRLDDETKLLGEHFASGLFSVRGDVAGFELEAWLIDANGDPLPKNHDFLERLSNPLVVPELASYNVELNGSPTALTGRTFSRLHDELSATWRDCRTAADDLGCHLVTIGILPTIRETLLSSEYMSKMVRYQALNDRVMALRDGKPLELQIEGDVDLDMQHPDVMLEAATTSFQIHLQCKPERAVRDFNAAIIASAPMVAASANSPLLFGRLLWDETRIPLFEQAVDTGDHYPHRVSFGTGYADDSLFEVFQENQKAHPILIPAVHDDAANKFSHVRFHNGTIWRWNRPLIGFDHDGQVHLRIEHRVVPAGPTVKDCVANAALFFGLVRGFGLESEPIEQRVRFEVTQTNFYNAARHGLAGRVVWNDREVGIRELLLEELLPLARRGLQSYGIPGVDIDDYLGVVEARVETTQNGATWQRRWIGKHGLHPNALVMAYLERQDQGDPVHTWAL
ncbi:MAG: glutamate--cysteine ligase [Gammaproteobacteria bacterium]|nr:glutamate--cysteine ligase [Gammaproteobacteria bacterium]